MIRFLLKRVLIAVPMLFIVAVIAFFLARSAPGDTVAQFLVLEHDMGGAQMTYPEWREEYSNTAQRIDRHLPPFYVEVLPSDLPDTLYAIEVRAERRTARELFMHYGNWPVINEYMAVLRRIASDPTNDISSLNGARYLLETAKPDRMSYLWSEMATSIDRSSYDKMISGNGPGTFFLPSIRWFGMDNQFHRWLTGLFRGDWGVSVIDGRPVATKITEAVKWTLRINLTALLLAFGIAIPLGLLMARRRGSAFDRFMGSTLFIFFAIPSFWLATLLIVFFTTPEYGLDLFPSGGLGSYQYSSGVQRSLIIVGSLFLPVLSLTLGALAYLTRQMRDSVVREADKDYVRMAKAKGLSDKKVYRKHILRNAMFPMYTLIGAALPAAVSGSVIIEVIFSIPGMGRLLYESIIAQDWMVVYAMVVIATVLTVLGYILSDVLYRSSDRKLMQKRLAI